MISSSSRRKGRGIVDALLGAMVVIAVVVTMIVVGLHRQARLMAAYRGSQADSDRREAALLARIEQLSTIDVETGQEHDDGVFLNSIDVVVTPTPAPSKAESASTPAPIHLRHRDSFDCYFAEDCEPTKPKTPPIDHSTERLPLWLVAAERLVVSAEDVISSYVNDEDSLRFERRILKRGHHKAMVQVKAAMNRKAATLKGNIRAGCSIDAALSTIKMALTEESLSAGRTEAICKLGSTRREQLGWLKRQRAGRVVFVVVGYELTCDYPKLERIRSIAAAVRNGGYGREGQFVFACADPAAMAALCAAGFPAIATSDLVNEKAVAEAKIAMTEARLRQGRRRLLATTSGSPLADAALFESMLVDSALFATSPAIKEGKEATQAAAGMRSPFARLREALQFEFAADLSIRGISSICIDAEAVFLSPRRGPRRARLALDLLDEDASQKKKGHSVRIATRQSSSRLPCTSTFFAAEIGNSSSLLLRRLAKLSKSVRETALYSKALSSELQLESSVKGAISALAVACSPRPRFLIGRREELAAIVLEASPQQGRVRRRSLAIELGLVREDGVPSLIVLRDAAVDTYDLRRGIYKSPRFIRFVFAHLATAALVSHRTIVLPAVHHDGSVFFLWTYLDLQSLEDLGIEYRHTHYFTHTKQKPQKPMTVTAHKDFALVDRGHPKSRHFFPPRPTSPRELDRGMTPEDLLWNVLTVELVAPNYSHEKYDVLAIHLPFLAEEFVRMQEEKRAALNPALLLATKLRWCEDGLRPNHNVHEATANGDCYGRGTPVDDLVR